MKRRRMLGLAVVFGVAVTVMTVVALEGPGWAAPSQSSIRQTVPEPLAPRAYLPIVVSESVTVAEGGSSVPATSVTEVTYPGPGVMLPDTLATSSGGSSSLVSFDVDGPNVRRQSAVESKGESNETSVAAADDLPTELCRLGVDGSSRPINDYASEDVAKLRVGWYFNWSTSSDPPTLDGIEFAQSVFVKQWKWRDGELVLFDADAPYAEPYTYTVRPSISKIKEIAAANPGSLWLVGNEIERRDWPTSGGGSTGQNEILPEVYARVYHRVYEAIKDADPTARVANGSIIVPTPLRLEYMTRVWNEYLRVYRTPMPVDVWQIHVYLGPEERAEWGIDIPAGIDADEGMFCFESHKKRILVNKDVSYVPDLLRDFRDWMKERGQQNKPLMLTEFGVCMPDWVLPGEFTPEAIRDEYMYPSLDFLLNEKDPALGYPADEDRLVQSAWWYSLDSDRGEYDGDTFYQYLNGNLFWSGIGRPTHSPYTKGLSLLGDYWIDYTSALEEYVNLRALVIVADPVPFSPNGEAVTATLRVRVSNSGNVAVTDPFSVTVHDDGGELIGDFGLDTLGGCGGVAEGVVTWPDLSPGAHPVTVRVDPSDRVTETVETDNVMSSTVLVASFRVHLPAILRGGP
ncbi:MAG: CARDB domain-containing protein [bacterium]